MLVRIAVAGLLTLPVGCAVQAPNPASSPEHPANAGAITTELPALGAILAPSGEPSVHEADPFVSSTKPSGGVERDHADHSAPATSKPTTPSSAEPAAVYVCPMHADVISAEPGRCPKCKMKLVQKGAN